MLSPLLMNHQYSHTGTPDPVLVGGTPPLASQMVPNQFSLPPRMMPARRPPSHTYSQALGHTYSQALGSSIPEFGILEFRNHSRNNSGIPDRGHPETVQFEVTPGVSAMASSPPIYAIQRLQSSKPPAEYVPEFLNFQGEAREAEIIREAIVNQESSSKPPAEPIITENQKSHMKDILEDLVQRSKSPPEPEFEEAGELDMGLSSVAPNKAMLIRRESQTFNTSGLALPESDIQEVGNEFRDAISVNPIMRVTQSQKQLSFLGDSFVGEEGSASNCNHGKTRSKVSLLRFKKFTNISKKEIKCVAISPDGKLIVSGSASELVLWDSMFLEQKHVLAENASLEVNSVSFSPDGRFLISGSSSKNSLVSWDVATGHQLRRFTTSVAVNAVAIAPDSKTFVSGCTRGELKIWRASDGAMSSLECHTKPILCVVFAADGKTMVSGSDDKRIIICIIKMDNSLNKFTLTKINELLHTDIISSIAISCDGNRLVSGSHDNIVTVWELPTEPSNPPGTPMKDCIFPDRNVWPIRCKFKGHTDHINSVAISSDGKTVASGSNDRSVMLWDIGDIQDLRPNNAKPVGGAAVGLPIDALRLSIDALLGHSSLVKGVVFSPCGNNVVSVDDDGTLIRWDVAVGPIIKSTVTYKGNPALVAFLPNGKTLVFAETDNCLIYQEVATGNRLFSTRFMAQITSVAVSKCGYFVVVGTISGYLNVYKITADLPYLKQHSHNYATEPISTVAFCPNNEFILAGTKEFVYIWYFDDVGYGMSNPDKFLVLGHSFTAIQNFDDYGYAKYTKVASTRPPEERVDPWHLMSTIALAPDGSLFAGNSEGALRRWSLKHHRSNRNLNAVSPETSMIWECHDHNNEICSIAFSSNSNTMVSCSNNEVYVYNLSTCVRIGEFKNINNIKSVVFSPDGQCLLCGSESRVACLRTPCLDESLLQLNYATKKRDLIIRLVSS